MDAETIAQQEHRLLCLLEVIEKQTYELRENNTPGDFDAAVVEAEVLELEDYFEQIKDILYGNDDNEGLVGS
jgi:hypothetical protein